MWKTELLKRFVPFICLIGLLYCILLIISRDTIYGFLIPIDYLITLLVAFYILNRDLSSFISIKEDTLGKYGIKGQTRVGHEHLLPPVLWFGVGLIILFIVFFMLSMRPQPFHPPTVILIKLLKFITSEVIMVGAVFIFSTLTRAVLIDVFNDNIKTVLHEYLHPKA